MIIPPGLLRNGDTPELVGESDGVLTYTIWRGTRRSRRVARVSSGQLASSVHEGLLAILGRTWPSPGSAQTEPNAQAALAPWISQAGGSARSWITLLLQTGYLARYQPLAQDGLTPEGDAKLFLGLRGLDLLRQRRERLDSSHSQWAELWSSALSALTGDHKAEPVVRLMAFLHQAAGAVNAGAPVEFPGGSFSPGTHRQQHVQLALDFLVAAAARMISGSAFDWKEIGAHYNPAIGASKQFDAHQDRLVDLLAAVTGATPGECGLISLGSLYSLYGTGPLTYSSGGVTRSVPHNLVWSISSDELDSVQLAGALPLAVVLTENRALLLKMAHTEWPIRSNVLVLGIDGQPRGGLLRLLQLLAAPILIWVDTDTAGLSIGQTLQKAVLNSRWVLPPLADTLAVETGNFSEWQSRMAAYMGVTPMEQEVTLGGPDEWNTLVLAQIGGPRT